MVLTKLLNGGDAGCNKALEENSALLKDHSISPIIHNADVKKRVANIESAGVGTYFRQSPYHQRIVKQKESLQLPMIPTTTIGSFPQSAAIRAMRAKFKSGRISEKEYWDFIHAETEKCIRCQEKIGQFVLFLNNVLNF